MPEIKNIKPAKLNRILDDDAFGKFIVLSESETSFIQAGNDWSPGPDCAAFIKAHNSDPWVLEYHDPAADQHYRAAERVTLEQVRVAFQAFLAGDPLWRRAHTWEPVSL